MLYNDSSGPAVEKAVLERMKRLDPSLELTFSQFAVNPLTSKPLEVHPSPDWETWQTERLRRLGSKYYLLLPAFHLWIWDWREGRYHYVKSYPAEAGFGHREVYGLEADAARWMSPSEILRQVHEAREAADAKRKQDLREEKLEHFKANDRRIRDLLAGKEPRRDAKIVSYPGQGNRGSRGRVEKDSREDGWELPDQS